MLVESESVRMGPDFQTKLDITERSFMNRVTVNFNQLPPEHRKIPKKETFNKKLKVWGKEN